MLKALSIFSGTIAGLGAIGGSYILYLVMTNDESYKDVLRTDFAEEPTESELDERYWTGVFTFANIVVKSTLIWGGISAALAIADRITK